MINAIFYFALLITQAPGKTLPLERPTCFDVKTWLPDGSIVYPNSRDCKMDRVVELLERMSPQKAILVTVPGSPLLKVNATTGRTEIPICKPSHITVPCVEVK